jgi:homogentisate 1,2-dioxygenase
VTHWGQFEKSDIGLWRTAPSHEIDVPIAPMRWNPIAIPNEKLSFLEGVRTITTAGDAGTQAGMDAHIYLVTRSMVDQYFYNPMASCFSFRSRASCDAGPNSASSTSDLLRSPSSLVA